MKSNAKGHSYSQEDNTCCNAHEVCEKAFPKPVINDDIEYYDDEELDVFKGKKSNEYVENEVENFREILYTMQVNDIKGWFRSLQLRGIELPDDIKDETLMLTNN